MSIDYDSSCSALRFRLRDDVAIEDFNDQSLVLLRDSMQLRQINGASRHLLSALNGMRTIRDIAILIATEQGSPLPETAQHVADGLLQMESHGIVRRVVNLTTERSERMNKEEYLINPDVSFRPEGDDGAILFNADTDSLEVINPTAMAIWIFMSAPRTQNQIVKHLCEVYDDAPQAQVEKDVAEFLELFLTKGFVGIVEKSV